LELAQVDDFLGPDESVGFPVDQIATALNLPVGALIVAGMGTMDRLRR
jgi:hypothetical protein